MRESLAVFASATLLASGSACAMSTYGSACRVIGGEKLPAESGGADALCKAIANAAAENAPGVGYNIEVTVLPRSRLSATLSTSDGRKLGPLNFARMDKPLSGGSFRRFAASIAVELAKAGEKKS